MTPGEGAAVDGVRGVAMPGLAGHAAAGAGRRIEDLLRAPRARVDAALLALVERYAALDAPPPLLDAMRYALLSGGKRIRPFLVLQAASVCGAAEDAAMPAACAVEMVHAFSLVQDDLPCMDDEVERRGRPTCHRAYGEAIALLAADSLFALAFEVLAEAGADPRVGPQRALAAIGELARAAGPAGMAGGQTLDLTLPGDQLSPEQLHIVHRGKTGSLIVVSLRLGAILAGAGQATIEALETAGVHMGILYQIVDDLLDLRHLRGGDVRLEGPNLARVLGDSGAVELAARHAAAARTALTNLGPAAGGLLEMVECIGTLHDADGTEGV